MPGTRRNPIAGSVVPQDLRTAFLRRLLPPWTQDAACKGSGFWRFDKELPSSGAMTGPVLAAKRICYGCPVQVSCLGWALDLERGHAFRDLILGGTTGKERARLAH